METLSACIVHYELQPIATWSPQVWDALKFEVLNATEDDLADEALRVLQTMAEQLSYDGLTLQTLERTPLFRFVDVVAKECVKHLHEPQQRYARQSGQIIGKVASGSPFSFHLIIKGVFPELMTIIEDTDAITKKKELLEVINKVLDARFSLVQAQESSEFPALGLLDAVSESCAVGTIAYGGLTFFRDILFEMFALCLTNSPPQETSIRITAVRGLLKLAKLPGFLAPIEVGMIIQHFDKLVLDDDVGDDLRDEAILALQEVAKLHEQPIIDISFSALLAALPDVLMDDKDTKDCLPVLEALARIGSEGFPFTILSLRIRNKLDDVLRRSTSQIYAHTILAGLLYTVRQREAAKSRGMTDTDNERDHAKGPDSAYIVLVKHLYRLVTCAQGQSLEKSSYGLRPIGMAVGAVDPDEIFLDLVGKISMTVVRSMTAENQMWAADQVFTLFDELRPDHVDLRIATQLGNRTLTLSMHILAGLHREVCFKNMVLKGISNSLQVNLKFNPQQVCCTLIQNVSEFAEPFQGAHESILGLIALLFNKWTVPSGPGLGAVAEAQPQELVLDALKTLDSKTDAQAANILRMGVIFTMAANLKGARGTPELLCVLVKLLSNIKHGSKLAKEFSYILAPSELLSKENFAVMRGPYKQRPYAICVPQIVDLFKACKDPETKTNYLVALSGILKHTPTEVVLPEIESLLPILLQSMETFGSSVKAASIEVLRTAIVESPSSIEGHLRSIIKRLYGRIHNTLDNPSDAPSTVRVMALKCLGAIPGHVNSATALHHKTEVLRELEYALNDVKRIVRDEAVRCRFAWFNLTEKADDSD
jgi:DNA repair/transcription protein MET18/MMS19